MIILSITHQMNMGNAVEIMLLAFGVVFVILASLVFLIWVLGKTMAPRVIVSKKVVNTTDTNNEEKITEVHIPALETAAIATAIYKYYNDEIHDSNSHVITIKKVQRRYSPWNSKIYGLNNLVR